VSSVITSAASAATLATDSTDLLSQYSSLLLFSAMFVYALAFVAFALDLGRRSALATAPARVEERETVSVGAAGSSVTPPRSGMIGRFSTRAEQSFYDPHSKRSTISMRIGYSLTVLGWVLHVGADVLRGIAADRVPWGNMYEFALTATAIVVGVFLVTRFFIDVRFLGTLITGLALLFLGVARTNYYVEVMPLVPALQSYWLVIHVFVAILGSSFFALGFGMSVAQLLQTRREALLAAGRPSKMRFLDSFPNAAMLENLAYRIIIVGFIFWTFTLIAGAIWAEKAWGRYWGWDTKEVWTFIIWVLFAGYIHARATRGWRGSRSAVLAIVGFSAVLFNFTIVNIFFKGLHAYSGLNH
jgi:cytochrome c-type biogenesis protein CcsB